MPSATDRRDLDAETVTAVRRLADRLESRYGAPPLNDQALSGLADHDDSRHHLLAWDGAELAGYAQVTLTDGIVDAEVAAGPPQLDQLVTSIESLAADRPVRIWAHGRRSPLRDVLAARGYAEQRVLWQLRRALVDLPSAPVPDGVAIRPFALGRDESAWLAVNAAAFARHAEQGRWTLRDLRAREAEAWFDPSDFLLAWRGNELLGYHWTKVHADGMGEVYVLGVAPAAQGLRLGSALLDAGLAHLAGRGCSEVLLYVDDDNLGALRLYERSGFARHDVDAQYLGNSGQRPAPFTPP